MGSLHFTALFTCFPPNNFPRSGTGTFFLQRCNQCQEIRESHEMKQSVGLPICRTNPVGSVSAPCAVRYSITSDAYYYCHLGIRLGYQA